MSLINKLHIIRFKLLKDCKYGILFIHNGIINNIAKSSIFPRSFLKFS